MLNYEPPSRLQVLEGAGYVRPLHPKRRRCGFGFFPAIALAVGELAQMDEDAEIGAG
jgi:hypothetical protein